MKEHAFNYMNIYNMEALQSYLNNFEVMLKRRLNNNKNKNIPLLSLNLPLNMVPSPPYPLPPLTNPFFFQPNKEKEVLKKAIVQPLKRKPTQPLLLSYLKQIIKPFFKNSIALLPMLIW
jgi:hypothetical protein